MKKPRPVTDAEIAISSLEEEIFLSAHDLGDNFNVSGELPAKLRKLSCDFRVGVSLVLT